jgi:uncharacterized membrane protein (DUF106 family)
LVLIEGATNLNIMNREWIATYKPFNDTLFLISFILVMTLASVIVLVAIVFVWASLTDYQINKNIPKNANRFKKAKDPPAYERHI